MALNKSDLPYLFETQADWEMLPNGVEQQITWEYWLNQATWVLSLEEDPIPILAERVQRNQCYRVGNYQITASAVDAWHYRDQDGGTYSQFMLGYQGYWTGEVCSANEKRLQPEVAILLGYTHDLARLPAFIETVYADELLDLLQEVETKFRDDDLIAFSKPSPIGVAPEAPDRINDAMRRMRAQTKLKITRGRSAALEHLMQVTGVVAELGGWRIHPQEIERRQQMRLR